MVRLVLLGNKRAEVLSNEMPLHAQRLSINEYVHMGMRAGGMRK